MQKQIKRQRLFGRERQNLLWRTLDKNGTPGAYMITEQDQARPIALVPETEAQALKLALLIRNNPAHWSKSPRAIDLRGDRFFHCLIGERLTNRRGWLDGEYVVRVHDDGRMITAADEFRAGMYGLFVFRGNVVAGFQPFRGTFDQWCEERRYIAAILKTKSGRFEPSPAVTPAKQISEEKGLVTAA